MTWNEPENAEQVSESFEEFFSSNDDMNLMICHDEETIGMIPLFNISETAGKGEVAY